LGAFACFEDSDAFLVTDLDARRFPGTFPILGSPCQDKIAGVQRCFLEVLRIGWKNLPAWMDRMLGNSRRDSDADLRL
jgi:hypothetical protein